MFTTPPPPRARVNPLKLLIFIVVALGLLSAAPALAQENPNPLIDMQLAEAGPDCLWIQHIYYPGQSYSEILIRPSGETNFVSYTPSDAQANQGLLKFTIAENSAAPLPDTAYLISLGLTIPGQGLQVATREFRTAAAGSPTCGYVPKKKDKAEPTPAPTPTPRPLVNTCPGLLPDIVVSGYASFNSQCQLVDAAGVGRLDLVLRGIAGAVDIWHYVPQTGVEVCFRAIGAEVVFLDAAYSPRRLSTLDHIARRNGMTCALIHTAGTVVLLAS